MRRIPSARNMLLGLLMLFPYQHLVESVVYIESWKNGTRQVKEQTISIMLDAKKPEFEMLIRDRSGIARYKLSVRPGYAGEAKTDIVEWMVDLVDVTQGGDVSLLKPSADPEQDYYTARDRLGWLYPAEGPRKRGVESDVVPLLAKRVVKVEAFFCVIQVNKYKFIQGNDGVLQLMSMQIKFTNKNPIDSGGKH